MDERSRRSGAVVGAQPTVDRALGVRGFEVTAGQWVDVVAYTCQAPVNVMVTASAEHVTVAFVDPRAIADGELPEVYRELIARSETLAQRVKRRILRSRWLGQEPTSTAA